MSDKESDWNVPSSDGEEDSAEAVQSQSGKEREIPLNVLRLYSEIEKNGYLELKVKEYRSGVNNVVSEAREQENEEAEELNEATADIKTTENDETPAVPATDKDKAHEPSAFDYTEESIDETSLITRKIPKTERLQRKRVGTLENVISDLKRFRDMDNKESTDTDKNAIPPETRAATNEEQTEPQEHGLEQ